ncbi:MAG: UDP-N-acetylmuramate dehydrogenase [Candidatus Omnitrophica bacterium]|nr:UDP-N-acetylmuramate dehydrogenase [Candidatus Omnitrophota bacterium]MDD5237314.1 UDP-N-acetylmuramate dehydrogenase [Candidatus Omnitrophota bacterium]MDD5610031.1 UDP-N-acetylmuramate dehydrogenase [Candidatus Omnitrophota bacterium]
MTWSQNLRKRLKSGVFLSRYTTFRIGGKARFFIEPKNVKELTAVIKEARKAKVPYYILGNGSNLLVSDKGINGVVIKLSSPYFKKASFKKNIIDAGAGLNLGQMIEKARNKGLGGCEFLSGIPATVGGAVMMNAGARGDSISGLIKEVKVLDKNGKVGTLGKGKLKFGYRKSNLSQYILLSAKIKLEKRPKGEIGQRISDYLSVRRQTQDTGKPNAGCVFKNPAGDSAGRLIDLCGLKGKRVRDAQVSFRHANFIVNRGRAKAEDVLKLASFVKQRVKERFGVALEEEIKIWQ